MVYRLFGICLAVVYLNVVHGQNDSTMNSRGGILCRSIATKDTMHELSFDPNHIHCIQISMAPLEFNQLKVESIFGISTENRDSVRNAVKGIVRDCTIPWPSSYNWYTADIVVDGHRLDRVGIRKKGFLGSVFSEAPSFKIKTNKYVSGQFLGNTERLTLNNNAEDGSSVLTCLFYEVFARAGYPAPLANLANVSVNGYALGAYTHVEPINRRFLQRTFGNDHGHLYEGVVVDLLEDWMPRWECKTRTTDIGKEPLLQIAKALGSADSELVNELGKHVNLDNFITFWALEVLINNADGFSYNRNNFYVYFDPSDSGRATFIPWSLGTYAKTQNSQIPIIEYLYAEIPRRLSRIPAMRVRFENVIIRLLDEVWDEETLISSMEGYADLVRTARSNPNQDNLIEHLRTWILDRRSQVMRLIGDGIPPGRNKSFGCFEDRS